MARKQKDQPQPKPTFGSNKWVAAALQRKYQETAGKPGETLSGMTDYLYLGKLHRTLWKPETRASKITWVDPANLE